MLIDTTTADITKLEKDDVDKRKTDLERASLLGTLKMSDHKSDAKNEYPLSSLREICTSAWFAFTQ